MTPKSLLSRPEAVSTEEDFLEGACFQEILPDLKDFEKPEGVERVVFCTGKVFYDLAAYRDEKEINDTAIIRIEQLYPFNVEMLELIISQYPQARKWVWAQGRAKKHGCTILPSRHVSKRFFVPVSVTLAVNRLPVLRPAPRPSTSASKSHSLNKHSKFNHPSL